jgi:hypothetical protein
MTKDTARPVTAVSRTAARLSFAAAAAFVVLVVALHLLKPELDPSWHFISEYAIGRNGWMMVLAFLSLALSYVSLFVAIRSQLRTIAGRIGLALLLVSALGMTIAAIFTTDPITVSEDAVTTEGTLHNLGGTLGIAMPFAVGLIGWSLARNPAWSSAKRHLLWVSGLALVAFLVSFVSLGVMVSQNDGKFGPKVMVGWPHPFRDTGLLCVADGGGLASDPGAQPTLIHRGSLTLMATAAIYIQANGLRGVTFADVLCEAAKQRMSIVYAFHLPQSTGE